MPAIVVPLQAETNGQGVQGVAVFCIMGQTVGVFLAVKQEIKHKRRVSLEATSKKSLKSVFSIVKNLNYSVIK